jgi:antibiotic biosynthesis monooxygenase (ABM) superfamily enzyme
VNDAGNEVTEVITTDVKPGKEDAYQAWAGRVEKAQQQFKGYHGSFVQPPAAGEQAWTTLMRFDSVEHLQTWMNSPQRAALLKEREDLIEREMLHSVTNSFPGWIANNPVTGKPPNMWKTASLVLLTLYPVVMFEIKYLMPVLGAFNLDPALKTFLGNALSVALTTWPLMPLAIRAFHGWIFPEKSTPAYVVYVAPLVLVVSYFLEFVFFTYVLR